MCLPELSNCQNKGQVSLLTTDVEKSWSAFLEGWEQTSSLVFLKATWNKS